MNIVISQSMLFPWVGLLEQIRLADVFVHYDDVQFSKGSFTNRVQIKTASGLHWMTIPLEGHKFGQAINEVRIQPYENWMTRHLGLMEQSFKDAPYEADAMALALDVYSQSYDNIGMLARQSMLALADYYGLLDNTKLIDVTSMDISGSSSQRVLEIVKSLNGTRYISGHGARKYLSHNLFESEGIQVAYMEYQSVPYHQSHGIFTPFVSGLDLVAHCGREGSNHIVSTATNWKDLMYEPD